MRKNGIILSHFGKLKYDTIGELLRELDVKMKELNITDFVQKKIYAVIVECLENIDRHKFEIKDSTNFEEKTRFTLELKNGNFIITTGNVVSNDVIGKLKTKLDHVNSLDEKELKRLYRKTLLTGELSEKGGAGVGIIDMAKISQNKIDYRFKEINDKCSFYEINLKINNTN